MHSGACLKQKVPVSHIHHKHKTYYSSSLFWNSKRSRAINSLIPLRQLYSQNHWFMAQMQPNKIELFIPHYIHQCQKALLYILYHQVFPEQIVINKVTKQVL